MLAAVAGIMEWCAIVGTMDRVLRPGRPCLACPTNTWQPGRIVRRNQDGTCDVQLDGQQSALMPYWYNVTPAELSVDDEALWYHWIASAWGGRSVFSREGFFEILDRLGYVVDTPQVARFWNAQCDALFGIPPGTPAALSAAQAYQLLRRIGQSAQAVQAATAPDRPRRYNKLWWNQTRQGGRQPEEIARTVTPADAYDALGIDVSAPAPRPAALAALERSLGVALPSSLAQLYAQPGISDAIHACHPNNPVLSALSEAMLVRRPPLRDASYAQAFLFVDHVRYDYTWAMVVDPGEDDGPIYLRGPKAWYPTAPSLAFFLWDLAQIGLCWRVAKEEEYAAVGKTYAHARPVRATDIGYAIAR